jgi:hypothetical protein
MCGPSIALTGLMHTNSFSKAARLVGSLSLATLTVACSDSPTQPVASATTFVTISVSCDVSVSHDGSQWRVNYCTNAVGGGLIANALIVPGVFDSERQSVLRQFGTCMNRHTAIEQQPCYAMLGT